MLGYASRELRADADAMLAEVCRTLPPLLRSTLDPHPRLLCTPKAEGIRAAGGWFRWQEALLAAALQVCSRACILMCARSCWAVRPVARGGMS